MEILLRHGAHVNEKDVRDFPICFETEICVFLCEKCVESTIDDDLEFYFAASHWISSGLTSFHRMRSLFPSPSLFSFQRESLVPPLF